MDVLWGSCCAMGTVIPPSGRAAAVQPTVGFLCWSGDDIRRMYGNWIRFWCKISGNLQLQGSSSPWNQMCISSCGEAACLFHPSARFPFWSVSHLNSSSFGSVAGTVWILEETFFGSHLGAVPCLPKFWVYSDASNVILFSSSNRGQGPIVLGIVKMPCKKLYIIQMGYREGKQKKE